MCIRDRIYALLFGMPGIPCIYYGSEWGAEGKKQDGDDALRPSFEQPIENDLTARITAMAKAHRESRALCYGGFKQLVLTNKQCIWERETDGERVLVAVNIDEQPYHCLLYTSVRSRTIFWTLRRSAAS